jgi:hypothetical protein
MYSYHGNRKLQRYVQECLNLNVQNAVNKCREPEVLQYEYITLKDILVISFSHLEMGYNSCTIIKALIPSLVFVYLVKQSCSCSYKHLTRQHRDCNNTPTV